MLLFIPLDEKTLPRAPFLVAGQSGLPDAVTLFGGMQLGLYLRHGLGRMVPRGRILGTSQPFHVSGTQARLPADGTQGVSPTCI